MPEYEELIQQSQVNVRALSDKLNELEELHQNIIALKNEAEGIPTVFNEKFQQIIKLSEDYKNTLGAATKKYLDGNNNLFTTKLSELNKETRNLESKIAEIKTLVERLEKIDLEKHFEKHQKTLSEIFNQITSINQTQGSLTQTLTGIIQTLGNISNTIDASRKESIENIETLDSKISSMAVQTNFLKKEVKTNRIIQIVGFTLIVIILIYLAVK